MDTGFDDVLAGEVYQHPAEADPPVTVAVTTATTPPAPLPSATPSPVVLPPPSLGLTPAGVQAALSLVHLPKLDWPTLSQLAREVAMNLKPRNDILFDYKLSQVQYDFLEANNDYYRNALAAACKEWHAPLSTAERIKVEAAAILEDSMLGLGARMQNKAEGLPGVIEAAKFFGKLAGVGEQQHGASAPGERFVINIDLGGDQKISVGVAPSQSVSSAQSGARTLPPDP